MKRLPGIGFTIVVLSLVAVAYTLTPLGVDPRAELAQTTPVIIENKSKLNLEKLQTIQHDNCDGKGESKRIEVRSHSNEAEISAELAAQIESDHCFTLF